MSPPAASRPNDWGTVLRFGGCELHVLTREFWREGQRLPIPRRVFDLLLLLMQHRPRAVSHAEIAKAVWGRTTVRATAVAQAVMQARQLVGDAGDEPACLLSVRGVGYRFAGAVAEGAPSSAEPAPPSALDELHAVMADADAAREEGDLERAHFLADRAVVMAHASGINRERAQALSLAAWVAIARGALQEAASLAAQALRVAEAEGLHDVAAEARLQVGRVRTIAGDLQGALGHLHAAHAVLRASGNTRACSRCERLIALAYREMAAYEQALAWCARSIDTALAGQHLRILRTVHTLRVDISLLMAQALADKGQCAEARAVHERALALNEAMRSEINPDADPSALLAWVGNQIIALTGLGRADEAWEALGHMRHLLDTAPRSQGPTHPLWLAGLHRERAVLLAGTGRHTEAVAEIEKAVQLARAGGLSTELPPLLKRASRLCEQAGRLADALAWLHDSHAEQQALQVERAASQALVLQAEADVDALRGELQAAREQAQQLALENRVLSQRVQLLESRQAQDHMGFAGAEFLRAAVQPRHADARARDMPFCIALLVVDNLAELPPPADGGAAAPWLHELARALADETAATHEIAHWRPGLFVHVLADLGERRAREACQRIERRLAAHPWRQAATGSAPRLRVLCTDAAREETLDAALNQLLQRAGGQHHALA